MKDEIYQKAVDLETDRLARLSPCELMRLVGYQTLLSVDGHDIPVQINVIDLREQTLIEITASRQFVVWGRRKFSNGILCQATARRMTDEEAASYFD